MARWDPKEFQATLQAFLERRGWSRNEFAMRVGISQGVVNRWFQTDQSLVRPRPDSLIAVAEVMEVSHTELMRMCGYLSSDQQGTTLVRDPELETLIKDLEAGWASADETRRQIGRDTVRAVFDIHPQRRPNRRTRKSTEPENEEGGVAVLVR